MEKLGKYLASDVLGKFAKRSGRIMDTAYLEEVEKTIYKWEDLYLLIFYLRTYLRTPENKNLKELQFGDKTSSH